MSLIPNTRRKATDADIIRLNSLGLTLGTMGKMLGCHPSTCTNRLTALKVAAVDTRRSFIEDIYFELTESQQNWLANQVGPNISIKDFVKNLIIQRYASDRSGFARNENQEGRLNEAA